METETLNLVLSPPAPPNAAEDPPAAVILLPDEVIIEFLSFLEVKDLMRMKCVCKSWNTIISDPIFAKMHLKKKKNPKMHLALLSFTFKDCRAVSISRLLEFNSITLTDDYLPYNCRFNYKDFGYIVGSCNGLVCLLGGSFVGDYLEHSLSFWNPATRTKSDTLVSFRSYYKRPHDETCKFAFGYDNSIDTYKVVMLTLKLEDNPILRWRSAARVFTLGDGNNAWRDIQCFPVEVVPHRFGYAKCDNVYLNNSINWLVSHKKNLTTTEQFVIVSLDLGTETYTQMLLPQSFNEELLTRPFFPLHLSVLMDCISFSYDFMKTHFIIWKMGKFGVEDSWTQFLKIRYMNLYIGYIPHLIPLCLSEDGDTIIFSNLDQVIIYNWRNNTVDRRIKIIEKTWSTAKVYVESLISTDLLK